MNRRLKLALSVGLLATGLASAALGAEPKTVTRVLAPRRPVEGEGITAQAKQGVPDWVYSPTGEVAQLTGLAPAGYGYGRRNVMSISLGQYEGVGSITSRRTGFPLCYLQLTYSDGGNCLNIVGCEPLGTLLSGCGTVQ